ncbi:hypothetical protein ACNKHU_04750 [Shigella flexneri]
MNLPYDAPENLLDAPELLNFAQQYACQKGLTRDLTRITTMTTLKLEMLSDRIKAHKNALVQIAKPPVCTERAQHHTEMYPQHLDKPIGVRRALALAHHLRIAPSALNTMS